MGWSLPRRFLRLSPLAHHAPNLHQPLRKSILLAPCGLYCREMDRVLKAFFCFFLISFLVGWRFLGFVFSVCYLQSFHCPTLQSTMNWNLQPLLPRPAAPPGGASKAHLHPLPNNSTMISSICKLFLLLHFLSSFRTWTWILAHCCGRLLFSGNGKVP